MPKTTAETLGQYQKELADTGIPQEIINDIVRHAAFSLHDNVGICLARDTDAQVAK